MKEKTVQDPGYTAAEDAKARRDPGQMSLSLTHAHIYKNTHTPTRVLHSYTDETPTARHSVMTHAIIAFPPAVSENTGNSGVHHYGASSQILQDGKSLKRLTRTNTRAEIDSLTAMSAKPPLMKKL